MTLVVARLLNDGLRIEADSRITDEGAVRSGYLEGALKVVVLHPGLAVGFAGSPSVAYEAIARLEVAPDRSFDIAEVERALLSVHEHYSEQADFLIATLHPVPSLSVVRRGGLETGLPAAWVGDKSAFESYQRTFHSLDRSVSPAGVSPAMAEDLDVASRMGQAMKAVIDDPSVPTVDDLPIAVAVMEDGLNYAPAALLVGGGEQSIPSGVPTPLRFGSAAEGGFGYTICPPASAGVGVMGVHFHQGNLGALFHPRVSPRPIVFADVGREEFERRVQASYGIALAGGIAIS